MTEEKIGKIEKVDKQVKSQLPIQPNKEQFDIAMEKHSIKNDMAAETAIDTKKSVPSLMDQVREINQKVDHLSRGSTQDLIVQTDQLSSKFDSLRDHLGKTDFDLKSSYQPLLTGKLEHINDNLKILVEKTGGEFSTPPLTTAEGTLQKPIDRFLNLLTHGQHQLNNIAADLKGLESTSRDLTPANMLLVQIKVNQITQEIELFTAMLNKALESTKTIMNVQV